MTGPCVRCRCTLCTLSRLDLADGLRCGDCEQASWSEPAVDRPSPLPWWSTGTDLTWPAVLLLIVAGTVVLVGSVVVGQEAMCRWTDREISYCADYGQVQP